jgi:hypothetical protein
MSNRAHLAPLPKNKVGHLPEKTAADSLKYYYSLQHIGQMGTPYQYVLVRYVRLLQWELLPIYFIVI